MADAAREFDVVVYGATGYTGRLVLEYLDRNYRGRVRWALAGRDLDRLARARDIAGVPADVPLIRAEASNAVSVAEMAARTRGLISTVGPYQLHGSSAVAACASTGTDYVDMSGEPAWMRDMLDTHKDAAETSGARIMFSCGFDSIPFDLGVHLLQQRVIASWGKPSARVRCRVRALIGGVSGGTSATRRATEAVIAKRPGIVAMLEDPFLLTPGWRGAEQPDATEVAYDEAIGCWTAPLYMAFINVKHVHRTNWLTGLSYGADFRYDEAVAVDYGRAAAEAFAAFDPFAGTEGLASGDGPSQAERTANRFDLAFLAEHDGRQALAINVRGDCDPGYEGTARMLVETLLCAIDAPGAGGFWTPAALLGVPLVVRLRANAGLAFDDADPTALFERTDA